jgi:serine/threonine protein kinase
MAVKVSDLGLARMKTGGNEGSLSKLRGSYLYAAPETYHGEEYTSKCDVFSFGIVLWGSRLVPCYQFFL